MENKKLSIKHLVKAFEDAGYAVSPSWIRRQEDKGNLILPRSTTNFKMAQGGRRLGSVRHVSQAQIWGVLKAFLPEGTKLPNGEIASGTGYYNFKKEE